MAHRASATARRRARLSLPWEKVAERRAGEGRVRCAFEAADVGAPRYSFIE
jgi:hypothetical protein